MACFWNGLISNLEIDDFKPFGIDKKPSPEEFVLLLQSNNVKSACIKWQGEELIDFQLEENYQAVEGYNYKDVNSGYLCSTFDPFIFLSAEIFKVNVEHTYLQTKIVYSHVKNPSRTLKFTSSKGHFQATK